MLTHRRWWILGLVGFVLTGLVAGAQAASDLTGLVFLANRDSHDLVVIDAATDQIITRLPVGTPLTGRGLAPDAPAGPHLQQLLRGWAPGGCGTRVSSASRRC